MSNRFDRNKELISEIEQEKLNNFTVAVVGLGGLGGHIAEQLARLGIGKLILIDGDRIDESNLNRQLFAIEKNIGQYKTEAAKERLMSVNSNAKYICHNQLLNEINADKILSEANIVLDAVDNVSTRFVLQKTCKDLNIPLVHGSIGGWFGQVSFIYPGDDTLSLIYPEKAMHGIEEKLGNPAFIPAIIASIEVAEALKYILKKGDLLRKKMLYVDILNQDYTIINLY
jgi:molybdopterin/thiamine biosynthesis adenylyltransferase